MPSAVAPPAGAASPVCIAMVAGEASSDLLAAHLIRALRRHLPDARFYGIGGPRMQAEGFEAWWPAETLAVHGYAEALGRYRELSALRRQLLSRLLADPPAAFIGVDAPDFSLWLEERLRQAGIPAIHYVGPSIWAWRGGRIHRIKRAVSHMLCLFPFEPELYQAQGIPVTYVGHPLADEFPRVPDRAAARAQLGLDEATPVVAVLPGSRQSELRHLGAPFLQTIARLQQRFPQARFVVPLATPETRRLWQQAESALDPQGTAPWRAALQVIDGQSHAAMTAADVVLVASGTATLEAALLKRPMVIAYRMAGLSWQLMRHMGYLPWVGLPNILARRFVVPEFLQQDASPDNLAQAVGNLLADGVTRDKLATLFAGLHDSLRHNTAERAAEAILPYVRGEAAADPAVQTRTTS